MMGGLMSTRWGDHRKRGVVEDCLVIDAHEVARKDGRRTDRFWEGKRPVPVYYSIESVPEDIEQFQVAIDLADRAETQVVRLEMTHPHFGGVRWWFACPQCQTRCKKLYLPPGKWEIACRRCHHLTYTSSQTAHALSGDHLVQSVHRCCAGWIKRVYEEEVSMDWETPPSKDKAMRSGWPL